MSLPFRFKAGGAGGPNKMAPIKPSAHHHRSTTKVDHKPFKSRYASKSALKDQAKGKIESCREEKGKRRTSHQQVMSKLARRNQARQLRTQNNERRDTEDGIFQGQEGAAKHVAVVPVSRHTNIKSVIATLNESVDVTGQPSEDGTSLVKVERFRRNLLYMPTDTDLLNALDICKLADWVIIVLSANQVFGKDEDHLLRSLGGQGITNVVAVVQDMDIALQGAKRSKHLAELKSSISHYFPALEKVSVLDSKPDCANLVRSLCTASTKGIRWRDERSWMFIDGVNWDDSMGASITGTVRGKGLSPDRLVHIPGWGEFRIRRIVEAPTRGHKRKSDEMATEETVKEWLPSDDRDELAELAPEGAVMDDATSTVATTEHKGVLLDDHHYFSDDNSHIPPPPKKIPKGTSAYQAAWYLDDVSDSESDMIDNEDNDADVEMNETGITGPEDGLMSNSVDAMTEGGLTDYPESEMHIDAAAEDEARDLQEFRASRKNEADEDLEYPDEIELHPDVLARERLAKYRGLKNLRTSEWNAAEDAPYEPEEYKRLLQIADYKRSKNSATKEALAGGASAGTRIEIFLQDVPSSLKTLPQPSSLFSLLRHERKQAVINLNMTLNSDNDAPLKSKEELVVQIGHRRLLIKPVFSAAGVTPNDVHKFDRFLHPGRTAIATFTGPLTWGSIPVLVFKRTSPSNDEAPALMDAMATDEPLSDYCDLKLIGTATTVPPSHSRVIAKRVILTGHPYKIHKKLVTIRYMFFNREDVAWFAALPLWTKRGRQGFVKESLGTHGYFKATFDGKINPMDAVGVSLYKRVWPRPATPYPK